MAHELLDGRHLLVEQATYQAGGGVEGVVWGAAVFLARYLERSNVDWSATTVHELGAGTGLVGITCGLLGASVTFSDLPAALPLLKRNVQQNLGHVCNVQSLRWEEASADLTPADWVICCECVYEKACIVPLCNAIQCVSHKKTTVCVALLVRLPYVACLFIQELNRRGLELTHIATEEFCSTHDLNTRPANILQPLDFIPGEHHLILATYPQRYSETASML